MKALLTILGPLGLASIVGIILYLSIFIGLVVMVFLLTSFLVSNEYQNK